MCCIKTSRRITACRQEVLILMFQLFFRLHAFSFFLVEKHPEQDTPIYQQANTAREALRSRNYARVFALDRWKSLRCELESPRDRKIDRKVKSKEIVKWGITGKGPERHDCATSATFNSQIEAQVSKPENLPGQNSQVPEPGRSQELEKTAMKAE
jgi:hypothetical protein